MRTLPPTEVSLALTLVMAMAPSGCAVISGLDAFDNGVPDASVQSVTPSRTGQVGTDASGSSVVSDESDGSVVDPGAIGDGGASGEAGNDPDADGAVDGDDGVADSGQDAAAVCQAQCGGCCDTNSVCHGGQSVDTCGANGAICKDCSSVGKVCGSAGSCAAPNQVDAGTRTCSASKCTNRCSLLDAPCCKQDKTCGCAVLGVVLCN